MPKQKEIIQSITDERISTIPTVTGHEQAFVHANIHAPCSDDQDLSAINNHLSTAHIQFSGLAKITVGTVQPSNPTTGDLWIQTS